MNVITLISDFGTGSHYIASVKSAIYAELGEVPILDISHDISPWNLEQAVFLLASTYKKVSGHAFHLVGVNIDSVVHVAAKLDNHWFFAPDNGILTEVLRNENAEFFSLGKFYQSSFLESFYPKMIKPLIENRLPNEFVPGFKPEIKIFKTPQQNANMMKAYYVLFDRFGNAIVNIKKDEFYSFVGKHQYRIIVNRSDFIDRISSGYYQSEKGALIATFNSSDYLVISFTYGNAKQLFGFDKTQYIYIERY
ncbi:MAG: SAM-dependent chlorinase/fluorinase [Bacteroidetes bacterium]|nr:SAM-dependent chlorinase/fluorinase [Bacteroidota bacterium]